MALHKRQKELQDFCVDASARQNGALKANRSLTLKQTTTKINKTQPFPSPLGPPLPPPPPPKKKQKNPTQQQQQQQQQQNKAKNQHVTTN